MDWNDSTNKVTIGVGILLVIVLTYAIYRGVTASSRGSGMYRTAAQTKRINAARTILMVLIAVMAFAAIIWLLMTF